MSQNEQDQEAESIIKEEMINQRLLEPMQSTDNVRIQGDNAQPLGDQYYNHNGQSNELNENYDATNFSDAHIRRHEGVGGR